jgi:transposase
VAWSGSTTAACSTASFGFCARAHLARPAGALWAVHDLLQPLQSLAQGRGVWDRLNDAITAAYDGNIQMIDTSVVRMHQHAANVKKGVKFNLALKIAKFALYPALLMAALLVTASVIASTAAIHRWDS